VGTQTATPRPRRHLPAPWCVRNHRVDADSGGLKAHPDDFTTWHNGELIVVPTSAATQLTIERLWFDPDLKQADDSRGDRDRRQRRQREQVGLHLRADDLRLFAGTLLTLAESFDT